MFRDLFSSRLIQVGLVFCVLCVGGSLLYSWHLRRSMEDFLDVMPKPIAAPSENRSKIETTSVMSQEDGHSSIPNDTTDVDTSAAAVSDPDALLTDAVSPDGSGAAEAVPAEAVPVSPFGFGPYPEVPAGVSYIRFPASSADYELMMRVRLKLISQGINVEGATMEDGLVYPVIKGIGYVEWKSYWRPTGKVTYIGRYKGHPEDGARLDAIRFEQGKTLTRADVPPDIKLIPIEEGAIDPLSIFGTPLAQLIRRAARRFFS